VQGFLSDQAGGIVDVLSTNNRKRTAPLAIPRRTLCGVVGFMRLALAFGCVMPIAGGLLAGRADAQETVVIKATRPFGAKTATLAAELYRPAGRGPFPAVILMHGCGGWQPAVLQALHTHAAQFVGRGYVVLNLDSFGPRGTSGGVVCESYDRLVDALNYRTNDAVDALRYLQSRTFVDPARVFLIGQSNGGSVAVIAAKLALTRSFRAIAAYYPWCGAFGAPQVALMAPLIVVGGANDDWTPIDDCFKARSVGAKLTVVRYPNAVHSFDVNIKVQRYLGKLVGFDKFAAEDSRARILAFFEEQQGRDAVDLVVRVQGVPPEMKPLVAVSAPGK